MAADDKILKDARRTLRFGEFSFDVSKKVLWRGARTVQLAPKACEILGVLIENAPQVLSREDLMNRVWNDSFVEEANLTHHISALRKALGEDKNGRKFIETIPRRGYRFVAEVSEAGNGAVEPAAEITVSERVTGRFVEEIESRRDDSPPKQLTAAAPPRAWMERNKFSALAAAGVLLAALFGLAFYKFGQTDRPAVVARTPEPMTIEAVTNSGKVGGAGVSPDGKFIIYHRNYTEGEGALFIRQAGTNIETKIAAHPNGIFGTKEFSPDGAFVFYAQTDQSSPHSQLYRVPTLGGRPARVLERIGDQNVFGLSPDATRAAFFRSDELTKQRSLVAAALDGSQAEQILFSVDFAEIELFGTPAWSPDGRLIAFPARFAVATKNYAEPIINVLTFDTATGERRKMTEETWSNLFIMRWLPGGDGIVLVGARPRTRNQIYSVAHPSGAVRRVTSDTNGYGNYGLGVTKDGGALVADVWNFDGRLWTMDAGGDERTSVRLSAGNTSIVRGVTETPGGSIIFAARGASGYDLWTMRATDTQAAPLTSTPDASETEPVAAPDGSFVVFKSDRAGGVNHLFRADAADGSNVRQLTFGDNSEETPDISPDGEWVVYTSTVYDSATGIKISRLYRIPSAGGAPVRLTDYDAFAPAFAPGGETISCILPADENFGRIGIVSAADGGEPLKTFDIKGYSVYPIPARFTPDGESLIFRQTEREKMDLWKQNLAGGAPARFTNFENEHIYDFDFSPDGKRLLLSRGTTTVNVVMIKNFLSGAGK